MAKYEKRIMLGIDPVTGKQIRKRFYGNTKKELEANIYKWKKENENITDFSDPTFKEFAEKWLETYKRSKSSNTFSKYISFVKRCEPIHNRKIKEIKPIELQKILTELKDNPHMAYGVRYTMKQIFLTALENGLIAKNPAEKLTISRIVKPDRKAFTEAERKAIKEADLSELDRLYITILYNFGLRPAEAYALKKTDFKDGFLTVQRSIDRFNSLNPTKTGRMRKIPIPKAIESYLTQNFALISGVFLFSGKNSLTPDYEEFRSMSGRIQKKINKALGGNDSLKLTDMTMYSFRHDFATRLYYDGVQKGFISVKQAAEIMGHSELMFMQIYSHMLSEKENVQTVLDSIGEVI